MGVQLSAPESAAQVSLASAFSASKSTTKQQVAHACSAAQRCSRGQRCRRPDSLQAFSTQRAFEAHGRAHHKKILQ